MPLKQYKAFTPVRRFRQSASYAEITKDKPEKMRRAAFGEAVSERAAAGRVLVLEELRFDGERPRTREVVAWLRQIGDTGRTMVISPELDERIGRAVANLPDVELRTPMSLRLSDVMESDTLIVTRPALDALALRAGGEGRAQGQGPLSASAASVPTKPVLAPATGAGAASEGSTD